MYKKVSRRFILNYIKTHIIVVSNEHSVLFLHHIFIVSCRLSHACIITMKVQVKISRIVIKKHSKIQLKASVNFKNDMHKTKYFRT